MHFSPPFPLAALCLVTFAIAGCHAGSNSAPLTAAPANPPSASPAPSLRLVEAGRAAAVIVLPEKPMASVRYAADELAAHVAKSTGATLMIVSESAVTDDADVRIYLGDTRAARAVGIEAAQLPLETFRLLQRGNALFVAGRDGTGDPLDRDTSAGTLFGVYEWLERAVGVRWLWPGELGTFVPQHATLTAAPIDVTIQPRFFQRYVRPGLGWKSNNPALGFTAKAAEEYARVQTVFLRRQRMGRSERIAYGHAFTDWWSKYGREHPEWFQLVNGKRGPTTENARYAMCVSNPGLHAEIVAHWRAAGGATRPGMSLINVVENDILGQCECPQCRAWDGPTPADVNKYYAPNFKVYGAPFVSDRYARFTLAVQQLAARENPNAVAVQYAYFNYFQAPTSGVKLNENVLIGFCPSAGWYPRLDDEHAWYKAQWQGWRDTGARLFFRPNYFLDGYSMPFIFAHQFADDFQHHARNGMVATDFDALTGQWSIQGPNLYLLMRLHVTPDADPDAILAEYYAGFGAAAPQVKAYYDYWERYTMDNRKLTMDVFYDRVAIRWRTWAKVPHRIFPAAAFAPADALLAKAAAAVAHDPECSARVAFLQTGLQHAKLCCAVATKLTLSDPASTAEGGREALRELLAFRRAHEREWFANLNHNAWVEDLSWKLAHETQQPAEYYP
ncbi:DUF4838 domain-containing protein [Opitutus sp. ER46]|uniref:DUF4838 domain-containing protein n=1 Tax=Opitutus sp. ER46 TaxID=2161864 RepID=UPI000D31214F|nr:DUF4838 domain-containing protein [Opitutus sp. ER46]PTX94627.1 hypothetical protein DB354_12925 [Opitutus sp. ER46]